MRERERFGLVKLSVRQSKLVRHSEPSLLTRFVVVRLDSAFFLGHVKTDRDPVALLGRRRWDSELSVDRSLEMEVETKTRLCG